MRRSDRVRLLNLIAGVLSGCCWMLLVNSEPLSVTPCFQYEHCHSSKEGVHDLECYFKPPEKKMRCRWKSGRSSSNKSFTLVVEQQKQRSLCNIAKNINSTSHHAIDVFKKYNLTAYVTDANDDKRNCTKASFTGTPSEMVRCSPPKMISFKRHSGQLVIEASWVEKYIQKYAVKYRELNSVSWKEIKSEENKECIVGNLTSSLSYEVQVQCVTNSRCHQCSWSDIHTLPRELTDEPIIGTFDIIPQRKGIRLIVIHWKLANTESVAGYNVTVSKESGEFCQTLTTIEPAIRLELSGSAYNFSIMAFNSAGTSPSTERTLHSVQSTEDKSLNGKLHITFNGNSSFTLSWNYSLTTSYCCYSVEWGLKGERMSYYLFFQKRKGHAEIPLKDPLQPYKRYVIFLNIRPEKDTCNLKHINNSESTFGRTEVYVREGTPISAPVNITISNVTSSSFTIEWSSVRDEDAHGFLLGYMIHYTDGRDRGNGSVIIVHSRTFHYTLSNLKSQTVYIVRLSAFTKAGEGVRSFPTNIETKKQDFKTVGGAVAGVLGGIVVLTLVANLCSKLFDRAKKLFWPSIPNPGNSNAIQKIDGAFELEVLEPLNREKLAQVEESDTSSLHIIEGRTHLHPVTIGNSVVHNEEEEAPEDLDVEQESSAACEQTEPMPTATPTPSATPSSTETSERKLPPPIVGDYTTMELFHMAMPQHAVPQPQACQPEGLVFTIARPDQDYVRQALCHTPMLSHSWTGEELNERECVTSM